MENDKYLLSSVTNSIQILDLLGEEEMLGVAEISARLKMNKTSVFRYLYTLEAGGYVYKTADAKYMLGKKFIYMASIVEERGNEFTHLRPLLVKLRDRVNETVHLSILLPDLNLMFMEKVNTNQSFQMRSRVGYQMPAYQSGSGKVLLAGLLGTEREKELKHLRLIAKTECTITDHAALMEELRLTRRRGYGEENGEAEEGLSCLAVPVQDYRGETVAAISVSGLTIRLQEHQEAYLQALFETEEEVEKTFK